MSRADLARDIHRIAHLTGTFTLRSGRTATEYFDKYRFEADPQLLQRVAAAMAELVPPETEILAGLEMGGIPIATALSRETGLPAAFVRKKAKEYGTMRLAEGAEVEGRRVLVVEDVVTSGGQVVISAGDLRERGAIIDTVVCAIDRQAGGAEALTEIGLTLTPLLTRDDIAQAVDSDR